MNLSAQFKEQHVNDILSFDDKNCVDIANHIYKFHTEKECENIIIKLARISEILSKHLSV